MLAGLGRFGFRKPPGLKDRFGATSNVVRPKPERGPPWVLPAARSLPALNQAEADEILGIYYADWVVVFVDYYEVVDAVILENVENFYGEFVGGYGDGVAGEEVLNRVVADVRIGLEMSGEVSMGEDAGQGAAFLHGYGRTGAAARHGMEDLANGGLGSDEGHLGGGAHDLADSQKKGAAEAAAGVEAGEIVAGKAPGFEEDHGEGIAEDKHDGGAGGRGEIERTGFYLHAGVDDDVAGLGEGAAGVAGEGNDAHVKSGEGGQDIDQLFSFAAGGEGEDDVAIGDDAEVAVERVQGIEDDCGGAGGSERGGDLLADVAGFADAADDYFAPGFHAGADEIDRLAEGVTEAFGQPGDAGHLESDDAASLVDVVG